MNPMQMNANRTARLVAQANTPVYSTDTATGRRLERERQIGYADQIGCTEDFCFVCSRATDHYGEHSDAQLLAWAKSPRGKAMMGRK